MAETEVTIINKAIRLIRANPISALDDGSNEANIASDFYDNFKNNLYTKHPWTFGVKKVKLVASTTPLGEYRYAHTLPTDLQRLYALFDTDAIGANPIKDYDLQSPINDTEVFSNYETLWADYIRYKDEQYWPEYFIEFAYTAFAALIAMPITNQPDMAEQYYRRAWGTPSENNLGGLFGNAKQIDSMQKPAERIQDNPFISTRFS